MILRGGTLLTMDPEDRVIEADLRLSEGRIAEIAPRCMHRGEGEEEIDCRGCIVLPGFVQAHVHLCQTLFRGLADDIELLDWLRNRIWPFESWLDEEAMRVSADLGLYELIAGGTTAILDMGSVRHTGSIFQAAEESGLRYVGGKCLMDLDDGGQVPDALCEETEEALREVGALVDRWEGAADGRLGYAVAPRFAVSCSDDMLERAGALARARGLRVHTHASENLGEVEIVEQRTGKRNVEYLHQMGLLGDHAALAHVIHVDETEIELLRRTKTHVVHCPSSNLKLASGIAPIPEFIERGINVALGADGAPCNNRLSAFREIFLASVIHKPRRGPTAMAAADVLRMATMGGARAIGLGDEIGSIEAGKRADLIVLDLRDVTTDTMGDPRSAVVYSAGDECVRDVFVSGRSLKRDYEVLTMDPVSVRSGARRTWKRMRESFPGLVPSGDEDITKNGSGA